MWGSTRKSLTSNNTKILFIDSEGTSATDRGTKTYDSRIFALIVLISSLFIYNTTSNIDENGISELSLAAHLSKSITTNVNVDKESLLTELSPKFIWLLRDFTLLKTHPETGQEISSKEYLEICLRKKTSRKANDSNLIRDNIIKYFPDRDCLTLPRPVENEEDLQKLNRIPYDKLKSNFKMEFKYLKDKIFKDTLPKRFQGKRLNGPTLAQLVVEFVSAINSGEIPNINNSWDSVVLKDVNSYYNKALDLYRNKCSNLRGIMEQWELNKYLSEYKYEALTKYYKLISISPETFSDKNYYKLFNDEKEKLIQKINEIADKRLKLNSDETSAKCKMNVKEEFKELNRKLDNNYYTFKLVEDFNQDYVNCMKNYRMSEKCVGESKLRSLVSHMIENEPDIIQNFILTIGKENEKKINKLDKQYKENVYILEDLDSNYKTASDMQDTHGDRVLLYF